MTQASAPPGALADLFGHIAEPPKEEGKSRKELEGLAVEIFDAADGSGTDEQAIFDALSGLSPEDAARLKSIYADHYAGRDLDAELADELDEDDQVLADALLSGDPVAGAAARLVHAAEEDDPKVILRTLREIEDPAQRAAVIAEFERRSDGENLFEMIGDELTGKDEEKGMLLALGVIEGADAVDLDRAVDDDDDEDALVPILERCKTDEERAKLARAYEIRTGRKLDEDLDSELDDEDLDLARAVMSGDEVAAAAARIQQAATGSGTDEEGIFGQLEGNPERTAKVIDAYTARYGSFDVMIDDELTVLDQERAGHLAATGTLPPAFALHYAMEGAGTREAILERTMEGKTKAEMAAIEADYDAQYGDDEEGLREHLDDELDGRDAHYLGRMVDGEPEGVEAVIQQRLDDWQFERGKGAGEAGDATDLFSDAGEMLDHQKDRLLGLREKWRNATSDTERAAIQEEVDRVAGYSDSDVESFHKAQDTVTEIAAMVAGAIATLVTAGAGGPLIAGLAKTLGICKAVAAVGVTAVSAGGARMLTKELLKGDSYGGDEVMEDVAAIAGDVATGSLFASTGMSNFAKDGLLNKMLVEGGKSVADTGMNVLGDERLWNGEYDLGDFAGDTLSGLGDLARNAAVSKLVEGGRESFLSSDEGFGATALGHAASGAIDGTGTKLTNAFLDGDGLTTNEVVEEALGGGVDGWADRVVGLRDEQEEKAHATVAPGPLEDAITKLQGADATDASDMRKELLSTEAGRRALQILEDRGVPITFDRGDGSFWDGARVNIQPDRDIDLLAGSLVHEAHHAETFERDVDPDLSKEKYIRAALRNEAESQSWAFEHHIEAGRGGGTSAFGHDEYMGERQSAIDRFTAWGLQLSPDEMTSLARECGTQELCDHFGAAVPSTSMKTLRNGKRVFKKGAPRNYREHYGKDWEDQNSGP